MSLFFSNPDEYTNKNAIIESFWKPFAKITKKWLLVNDAGPNDEEGNPTNSADWATHIQDILKMYNTKRHFTTHEKPVDIFEGRTANRQTIVVAKRLFAVGDYVKIKRKPGPFTSATDSPLSRETYRIIRPGTVESLSPNELKEKRKAGDTTSDKGKVSSRRWFLTQVEPPLKEGEPKETKYSYSELFLYKSTPKGIDSTAEPGVPAPKPKRKLGQLNKSKGTAPVDLAGREAKNKTAKRVAREHLGPAPKVPHRTREGGRRFR